MRYCGYCISCRTWKPIAEFDGTKTRCNGCRHIGNKTRDRSKKKKDNRTIASQFTVRILQLKTPDALLKYTNRFCEVAGLTPIELFEKLAKYAMDDDCTPAQRIKIFKGVLHIAATAELAQVQAQPKLDTPEKVIRELHRRNQLKPVLKRLYLEGVIGPDDFDPPPEETA